MTPDNYNIFYGLELKSPIFFPHPHIPNIISTKDMRIVRLYHQTGSKGSYIVSPYIYLNQADYEKIIKIKTQELAKLFASVDYKKEKYTTGLEVIEKYTEKLSLSLEDKERISKLRDGLSAITSQHPNPDEFFKNLITEFKNILSSENGEPISDSDFNELSEGAFLPPKESENLKDYVLLEDSVLEDLDAQIEAVDHAFLKPQDKELSIQINLTEQESDDFKLKISSFQSAFESVTNQKTARLIELFKTDFFKYQLTLISKTAQAKTPVRKILSVIQDDVKVCSVCETESESKYCQNIKCETILSTGRIYKFPDGTLLDYLSRNFKDPTPTPIPLKNLKESDKRIMITKYGEEYTKFLKTSLETSEHNICLNHKNLTSPHDDMVKDLVLQASKKTAIFTHKYKQEDINGKKVYFWDTFRNNDYIYSIIQTAGEIKTPSLLREAKQSETAQIKKITTKIDSSFFNNQITYVKSDLFGQILEVNRGILDTNNPDSFLLKLGLQKFSPLIELTGFNSSPSISDIMFVNNSIQPTNTQEADQSKGESLTKNYLFSKSLSEEERIYASENFKLCRLFSYPFGKGYFLYEKENKIFKLNKSENIEMAQGKIDKIEYITIQDAIKHQKYKKWQKTLAATYLKKILSPNASASRFHEQYERASSAAYNEFLKTVLKNNNLVDVLYTDNKPEIIIRQISRITKSSSTPPEDFTPQQWEVCNIRNVSPFFWKELQRIPYIKNMSATILNNQDAAAPARLNTISSPPEVFDYEISAFAPPSYKLKSGVLNSKQFILNSLKTASREDVFTIAISLTLEKGITPSQSIIVQKYIQKNGLTLRPKTEYQLPVNIKTSDIIALLL